MLKLLSSTFLWYCLLCCTRRFELLSLDKILKCELCGTVYYALQSSSNCWVVGRIPKVWPFKWKLLSSTFLWYWLLCCTRRFELLSLSNRDLSYPTLWMKSSSVSSVVLFIMLYKVVLTVESLEEFLKYDHSNESYWAVLFCGSVYYTVQGVRSF